MPDSSTPDAQEVSFERPRSLGSKRVNLALQGGGSHGAFTWGVLERLLEDQRIEIEGISGTSAGAMNGAMLAYGMMEGGPGGPRDALTFLAVIRQQACRVLEGGEEAFHQRERRYALSRP
jgi:NTE family protein